MLAKAAKENDDILMDTQHHLISTEMKLFSGYTIAAGRAAPAPVQPEPIITPPLCDYNTDDAIQYTRKVK